jgi:GT2 family glycosyltransferase
MTHHAVALTCYDQLHLTKQTLASITTQDIGPLEIWIVNNGSTDGTREWLEDFKEFVAESHRVHLVHHQENQSPIAVANQLLAQIFAAGHDKVLGVPNDVVLPPNFYRLADMWPRGIVCGTVTSEREFPKVDIARAVLEHTPMAVAIIRRWAWDALIAKDGYFMDERFWMYASDCDFALRLAACGIRGVQLDLQYWHYSSATLKLALPDVRRRMEREADADRQKFADKWGFKVDDLEYGASAADINFRGEGR